MIRRICETIYQQNENGITSSKKFVASVPFFYFWSNSHSCSVLIVIWMLNSVLGFANILNQMVEHVVHVCTHVTIFPGNNFSRHFLFLHKKKLFLYLAMTGTLFEFFVTSYRIVIYYYFLAGESFWMEHTNWIQ